VCVGGMSAMSSKAWQVDTWIVCVLVSVCGGGWVYVCVCVCACAYVCACMCVCVCVRDVLCVYLCVHERRGRGGVCEEGRAV